MLPSCSSLFVVEPRLWIKASISEGNLDYRWFNFLVHCDHSFKNVAPECWILATTTKKKILQGDTCIRCLLRCLANRNTSMAVFFCTIPNTATAVANAESAKMYPTLLQRNRFDCAAAVISKPWTHWKILPLDKSRSWRCVFPPSFCRNSFWPTSNAC